MITTFDGKEYDVPNEIVLNAMRYRFEHFNPECHTEASDSLFETYLQLLDFLDYTPGSYNNCVDNFLVNADLVCKDDMTEEEWDNLVAIFRNDKYACVRIG